MPEGDTIHRTARTLDRALAGRLVTAFDSVYPALARVHQDTPLTEREVTSVQARGKHLLLCFSGDLILRTHMRMHGSWHIYRPREPWQRSRAAMRIVIATDAYVAVGFNIPDAEFLNSRALARHPTLRALGPDLLSADFDADEARRRLRSRATLTIAEALLDQRLMAGVGNVFKSEVLFEARVSPWAPIGELSDADLQRIVATALRHLRMNVQTPANRLTVAPGRRTTRSLHPAKGLWVYGRAGEACRLCATPIRLEQMGSDPRLTYWCPACQPDPSTG